MQPGIVHRKAPRFSTNDACLLSDNVYICGLARRGSILVTLTLTSRALSTLYLLKMCHNVRTYDYFFRGASH